MPEGPSAECVSDMPNASPTTCAVAAVQELAPPPGEAQARHMASAASATVICPCAKRAPTLCTLPASRPLRPAASRLPESTPPDNRLLRRAPSTRWAGPIAAATPTRAGVRRRAYLPISCPDDDGARRSRRLSGGVDSGRRDAAGRRGRGRGKVQSVGPVSHTGRSRWLKRRTPCAAPAPHPRGVPVPGNGRYCASGGRSVRHVADALGAGPFGHPIWLDMATRSARAAMSLEARGITMRHILTSASVHNAMVTHAASRLHQPDSAFAGGSFFGGPGAPHGGGLDARQPAGAAHRGRASHGPRAIPRYRYFSPEAFRSMLHLRRAGLLETDALTASGEPLATCSTGGSNPSAGPHCAECCSSAMGLIRLT